MNTRIHIMTTMLSRRTGTYLPGAIIKSLIGFDLTVDLQGRWIRYDFEGPDEQGILCNQEVALKFFNPKIGFSFVLGEHSSIYGLTGVINKEPNRDDYISINAFEPP